MLAQVLRHLKNWFRLPGGIYEGTYTIQGGAIVLPFLERGQYFRICESRFNDGLYQYGDATNMIDETFDGVIWALAVPQEVVELAKEIALWQEKNGAVSASPYASESFGGYSYTRAVTATGGAVGWQEAFRSRLDPWRKAREV